jgi:cytochrome c oxidase subunit 2
MHLPEQASTYAPQIDGKFHLIMWITGRHLRDRRGGAPVFLWKYRRRPGREVHYTHGNNRLEVIWTIIPALICVMLALLSRRIWEDDQGAHAARRAADPGHGRAVRVEHPLSGARRKVRHRRRHPTLNQLHFPVGKPSSPTLSSKDVIHSFFLPEFRVKQDAVPGMKTRIWFEATRSATGRSRAPSSAGSATSG